MGPWTSNSSDSSELPDLKLPISYRKGKYILLIYDNILQHISHKSFEKQINISILTHYSSAKKKKVIKEGNNPKPKTKDSKPQTNTNPDIPDIPAEIIVLSSSDDDLKTPLPKKPYRKSRKIKNLWAKHYKGEYFHTHTFLTLNTC